MRMIATMVPTRSANELRIRVIIAEPESLIHVAPLIRFQIISPTAISSST